MFFKNLVFISTVFLYSPCSLSGRSCPSACAPACKPSAQARQPSCSPYTQSPVSTITSNLLAGLLLVPQLVILSFLNHQRVAQVVQVLHVLLILACPVVRVLLVQLVHKTVVVPCSLPRVLLIHPVDHFLVLLGAVVRLVVLLSIVLVLCTLLRVPLPLLVDESLVQLQVVIRLVASLSSLSIAQVDVVVELVLFALTLLLQTQQVFFIPLQSGKRGLVSNCHLALFVGMAVAQRVVVITERTVGSKEYRHVRVVSLRDLFAVQSLLNDALKVTLRL